MFSAWQANPFDLSWLMDWRGISMIFIGSGGDVIRAAQKVVLAQAIAGKGGSETTTSIGTPSSERIVIVGWRGVSGKPDLDVARDDRFQLNSMSFRVTYIDDTIPGRREAYAESNE